MRAADHAAWVSASQSHTLPGRVLRVRCLPPDSLLPGQSSAHDAPGARRWGTRSCRARTRRGSSRRPAARSRGRDEPVTGLCERGRHLVDAAIETSDRRGEVVDVLEPEDELLLGQMTPKLQEVYASQGGVLQGDIGAHHIEMLRLHPRASMPGAAGHQGRPDVPDHLPVPGVDLRVERQSPENGLTPGRAPEPGLEFDSVTMLPPVANSPLGHPRDALHGGVPRSPAGDHDRLGGGGPVMCRRQAQRATGLGRRLQP